MADEAPKPSKKIPIHVQSSQNRLYIKRARVVNADSIQTNVDIYIEDGKIKFIGSTADSTCPGGVRVIDVAGKFVLPGGVDASTHFVQSLSGETPCDDFYAGTKASVAGGTTTVVDLILPQRDESLIEAYDTWRAKADGKVVCDYGLRCGVTWWSKSVSDEMRLLCEENGINTFNVFTAFKDHYQLNDSELYEVFEKSKEIGALVQVHAENGDIIAKNVEKLVAKGSTTADAHDLSRPVDVEAEAVNRTCVIARQVGAPVYITKVSSKLAADQITNAKRRGAKVFGEVLAGSIGAKSPSPSSVLTLTSPPLRLKDAENGKLLMKHLAIDDLQVVASGNCTFNRSQKEEHKNDFTQVPHGINGSEDRMKLIWEKMVATNLIDIQKFVALTSTNAAKILNIYPRKGSITVGADADLVIWNHQANETISSRSSHHANDYNIFEGTKISGVPEFVIVRGKVCVEEGNVRVAEGFGQFIEMPANSSYQNGNDNGDVDADLTDGLNEHLTLDQAQLEFEDLDYKPGRADSMKSTSTQATMHTARAPRAEGVRDQQKSSFSISKEIDDGGKKCSIRVRNPPGGASSGLW